MTVHDEWIEQLSDYLDGELGGEEQAALEAHLGSCGACTRVLNELRAVVLAAQSTPTRQPSADLWAGIADRIGSPAHEDPRHEGGSRVSFTVGQLAAAAVVLVALSGWATLRLASPQRVTDAPASNQDAPEGAADQGPLAALAAARLDDPEYDQTVADMKQALEAGRSRLDPATVKIVEEDLTIIDQAMDEARRALTSDPANDYLTEHFIETRRRKLDLLRHAAVLSEGLN